MSTDSDDFSSAFLRESITILKEIDSRAINAAANLLASVRQQGGRLFILGVGGSAGHATHAVNDFRKICGLEAYSPTDNVSELTARINDAGWDTCFSEWLKGSRVNGNDALLVFSVGGGSLKNRVSLNLVKALEFARSVKAKVVGVVGRDGGFTKENSDVCIIVPPLFPKHITPHTEGITAVIWHLLVSHPVLKLTETMWESTGANN